MKASIRLVILLGLVLPSISTAGDRDSGDAVAGIRRYVESHRRWKPHLYRIEPHGKEGTNRVYWVIYKPEEKEFRLGGGKSFEVIYDPKKRCVIEELHFQ